jgi:hypothetical protein
MRVCRTKYVFAVLEYCLSSGVTFKKGVAVDETVVLVNHSEVF